MTEPGSNGRRRYITSGVGMPTAGVWPCSPAVIAGGTCYISGQPPYEFATNALVGGTAAEQFDVAFSHVLAILRASGYERNDLVFVTVLLTDLQDYEEVNARYLAQFRGAAGLPARLTYGVHRLLDGARVEVQAIAHRDGDR